MQNELMRGKPEEAGCYGCDSARLQSERTQTEKQSQARPQYNQPERHDIHKPARQSHACTPPTHPYGPETGVFNCIDRLDLFLGGGGGGGNGWVFQGCGCAWQVFVQSRDAYQKLGIQLG